MIYFVRPIGLQGPVKIGIAGNIGKRLNLLNAGSPLLLEVIGVMEGGKELECRFHERFLGQQSHYEWFHWSLELQETIDQINAGTFDIETLPTARGTAPTQRGRRSSWNPERRKWMLDNAQSYARLYPIPSGDSRRARARLNAPNLAHPFTDSAGVEPMGGILEIIAFLIAAELIGLDCHWVQGGSTLYYAVHYAACFGIGIWAGDIADRLRKQMRPIKSPEPIYGDVPRIPPELKCSSPRLRGAGGRAHQAGAEVIQHSWLSDFHGKGM